MKPLSPFGFWHSFEEKGISEASQEKYRALRRDIEGIYAEKGVMRYLFDTLIDIDILISSVVRSSPMVIDTDGNDGLGPGLNEGNKGLGTGIGHRVQGSDDWSVAPTVHVSEDNRVEQGPGGTIEGQREEGRPLMVRGEV